MALYQACAYRGSHSAIWFRTKDTSKSCRTPALEVWSSPRSFVLAGGQQGNIRKMVKRSNSSSQEALVRKSPKLQLLHCVPYLQWSVSTRRKECMVNWQQDSRGSFIHLGYKSRPMWSSLTD
ncbi:hypothetical protein ILYODFUR_004460 [Ilyodon furcidens]|uniref:Uncharacterized protein n=1 Tax=Ilyodon furcidens TaxID=33524 RepID=A0ABV0SU55_9TELE